MAQHKHDTSKSHKSHKGEGYTGFDADSASAEEFAKEAESGISSQAADATAMINKGLEVARANAGQIKDKISSVASTAQHKFSEARSVVSDRYHTLSEQASVQSAELSRKVKSQAAQVSSSVKSGASKIDESVHAHPFLYIAGAVGLGILIGRFLKPSGASPSVPAETAETLPRSQYASSAVDQYGSTASM